MKGAVERPYGRESSGGLFDDAGAGLAMGQRVLHQKFGEGVVLQCEGSGERARVQVNFEDQGAKWLMLGYANLETLD